MDISLIVNRFAVIQCFNQHPAAVVTIANFSIPPPPPSDDVEKRSQEETPRVRASQSEVFIVDW